MHAPKNGLAMTGQSAIWQSPTREPSPLAVLVHEAVRTHLFPGEPGPVAFVALTDGRGRQASLPDGTAVRISLEAAPATRTRLGQRACAGLRVTGAMVLDGRAHRVVANVAIDLATRAVLSSEARWEEVGRVAATR